MTVKAFCVISIGMESENEKTARVEDNENKNVDEFEEYIINCNKTRQTQKKKTQIKRHEGVERHIINPLLTKLVRSRYFQIDIGLILWTSTSFRSINTQKENLANIQPSGPN